MFQRQQPVGQRFGAVGCPHRHAYLCNNRSAIQLRGDKMNAGAMGLIPRVEHPLMGVQPPVAGQQGRVDVDHSPLKLAHKMAAQHPHKPGEHKQIGSQAVQLLSQRLLKPLPGRKLAMGQADGGDARLGGPFKARCAGHVADHRRNHKRTCFADQGVEVTAAAGKQHHHSQRRPAAACHATRRVTGHRSPGPLPRCRSERSRGRTRPAARAASEPDPPPPPGSSPRRS